MVSVLDSHVVYKSVSYQAAVWFSSIGVGIESSSSPAPISPTSMSISYGDVGPTNDGLHNSNPWNESIGIGNVSYAAQFEDLFEERDKGNGNGLESGLRLDKN